MKYLYTMIFLLILTIPCIAEKEIKCYSDDKLLQVYTTKQLEALMSASQKLIFQEALEQKGEVYAKLSDDIYQLANGTYIGYLYIIWGKESYKKLTIKVRLQIDKTKKTILTQLDQGYTKTARWGCPVLFGLLIMSLL